MSEIHKKKKQKNVYILQNSHAAYTDRRRALYGRAAALLLMLHVITFCYCLVRGTALICVKTKTS